MKLSISNIGWSANQDDRVYAMMRKNGFTGLEIAPTRIFPQAPYKHIQEAAAWSTKLKQDYGFTVSSMQSIWFGRTENIFGTLKERESLLDYTKMAIQFAQAVGCKNLVFGCPVNRNMPENADLDIAVSFFKNLGDYAAQHGTVIGMEANPPIYHTNFINDTVSAIKLIEQVDSGGLRLNLDTGTMILNGESLSQIAEKAALISHVHISEPGLTPLKKRKLHAKLYRILKENGYDGFVSIEMGKTEDLSVIEEKLEYSKEVFSEDSNGYCAESKR